MTIESSSVLQLNPILLGNSVGNRC